MNEIRFFLPLFFLLTAAAGYAAFALCLSRKSVSLSFQAFPRKCEKGSEVCVKVQVKNRGYFPIPIFIRKITFQNPVTGEKVSHRLRLDLASKEERLVELQVYAEDCGYYFAENEKVFFIFPSEYPVETEIVETEEKTETTYEEMKKGNDSSECMGLREYQNGDSLRQIHFKLSEKVDSLIVREGAGQMHRHLAVVLDAGTGGKLSEQMAECFLTVIADQLHTGNEVTAVFYGVYEISDDESYEALMEHVLSVPRTPRNPDMMQILTEEKAAIYYPVVFVTSRNEKVKVRYRNG